VKFAAVIFTYAPDLPMAILAARSLARLGVRVALAVDRTDVLPFVEEFEVIVTDFPRRRNLNGLACADGILETLESWAGDADWIIKCDSDTLVFSLAWILAASSAGVVGVGYPKDTRHLFGLCYAIQPKHLPALREELVRRGVQGPSGEDVLIGNAAHALGLVHSYPLYQPGTPLWAWNWTRPRDPDEVVRLYNVICVQPDNPVTDATRAAVRPMVRELYQRGCLATK